MKPKSEQRSQAEQIKEKIMKSSENAIKALHSYQKVKQVTNNFFSQKFSENSFYLRNILGNDRPQQKHKGV